VKEEEKICVIEYFPLDLLVKKFFYQQYMSMKVTPFLLDVNLVHKVGLGMISDL